jgi:hypothetical protein
MKRIFVLIITFLVIGLAFVSAQDMARLTQLQQEVERIEAAANARGGTYTQQEQQRLLQIQQEMIQAMGPMGGSLPQGQTPGGTNPLVPPQVNQEAQRQQQQLGQVQTGEAPRGTRQGWPTAGEFRPYGFTMNTPRTNTPNGLTTYYEVDGHIIFIHIHKNWTYSRTSLAPVPFTAQEIQAIKREIEQAMGARFYEWQIYKNLSGNRRATLEFDENGEWINIRLLWNEIS